MGLKMLGIKKKKKMLGMPEVSSAHIEVSKILLF